MKTVLMVIAPEAFRDEEYLHPKEILEAAGARVVTASVSAGACTARFGTVVHAEESVSAVDPSAFDAVVFVGGGGSRVFFEDAGAHSLARAMAQAGKIVAAICVAPVILANAGLLHGRRATLFPSEDEMAVVKAGGAEYTGTPVEIDDNVITASGPEAARDFGTAIASALGLP